jgi:hypothetical protein
MYVIVRQPGVPMRMRMRGRSHGVMRMLMMRVMDVEMVVFHLLVLVQVAMVFANQNRDPNCHDACSYKL